MPGGLSSEDVAACTQSADGPAWTGAPSSGSASESRNSANADLCGI